MGTFSEPHRKPLVRHFNEVFASAERRVKVGAGNVHELRFDLEGPDLHAHSRLLSSGSLLFVLGRNHAREELLLRHESKRPLVALHVPLRGSAAPFMDGLGTTLTVALGQVQLFSSPSSDSTVHLKARERNEAFRITVKPNLVLDLAERHPELEPLARHVAAGTPYCGRAVAPVPLARMLDEATEITDSEHYGSLRPLFLEARALQ